MYGLLIKISRKIAVLLMKTYLLLMIAKNNIKLLLMNKAVVILLITSSLADIDTSACNMAEYLIKEMAKKQGVTEQLKAEDMMKWVGLMNNIRACADEILLNDIVYS